MVKPGWAIPSGEKTRLTSGRALEATVLPLVRRDPASLGKSTRAPSRRQERGSPRKSALREKSASGEVVAEALL